MGFNFSAPLLLLILIPILGLTLGLYIKYGKPASKHPLAVIIRSTIMILLVLSLAGMEIQLRNDETTVVFLADLSDSTTGSRDAMQSFIHDALKQMPDEYKAAVVGFGADAMVEHSPSNPVSFYRFQTSPNPNFTDLESAVKAAEGLMPAESGKRMVVVSDGAENSGDILQYARVLKLKGITVDIFHLDNNQDREVQISSLDIPSTLYEGEAYNLRVGIDSTMETSGILRLFANRIPLGEMEVEIQRGTNVFLFRETAEKSGTIVLEAQLEPIDDTLQINNRMSTYAKVLGPPVIALVEGSTDDGRELSKILTGAGLETKKFTPHSLPDELDELMKYEAVILSNVSYDDLGEEKAKILDNYVKNMGRGLLVTGGDNSYALGEYIATPLEDMLPVEMDLSNREELPSLALMLVIDKSGSMSDSQYGISRMELAKEAALRSLDALRDNDTIGIIGFDSIARWVVEPQSPEDKEKVQNAVATIGPGGGTNMYPGLQMAFEALKDIDAKLKHIIVLTDGHTQGGNFNALVSDMVENGITLTGVAVGRDSDTKLLEQLANLGQGRYYYTDAFESIPKIFTKETYMATQSYINNETFYPKAAAYSSILQGIDALPSLNGYITTTIKDAATPVLISHKGDPILAAWQYGLGRTLAWTSDARGQWTREWMSWEGAPDFWLNIVSYLLPGQIGSGRIETSAAGKSGKITVWNDQLMSENVDSIAYIVDPEGNSVQTPLTAVKPGEYQGEFPIEKPGVYLIRVEQQGEDFTNTLESGLSVNYSPEYDLRRPSSKALLEALANQTGGRILKSPVDVFKADSAPVWTYKELWPVLMTIAMFLLILDIAVRRLALETLLMRWQQATGMKMRSFMTKLGAAMAKDNGKNKRNDKLPSAIPGSEVKTSAPEAAEDQKKHKKLDRSKEYKERRKDPNEQPSPDSDFTSELLRRRQNQKYR